MHYSYAFVANQWQKKVVFVANQGQQGISFKKVAHQIRCVTFIFLYGLPPKPRAAIVWSLIINLPARKSCHTWWYSLCLEIARTRQLVSKTIFITIRYEILWSSEITQSTNSAYYPFLRLSSKKLINSSEILEISPLS